MRPLHKLSDLFNASLATSLRRVPALEAPIAGCSRLLHRAEGGGPVEMVRERLRRAVIGRAREAGDTYRTVDLPAPARMVVDITGLMGALYFDGPKSFEPLTTQFIKSHLPRGGTFVDVGANVGYFSLLAAGLVGGEGSVYAFEPNTNLHADFMRSVRANSFEDRVRLSEVAVSNADLDAVDFYVSLAEANTGLSTLTPHEGHLASGSLSLTNKVTVPARRLDSWVKESGVTRIDVLKIDVEGAEELVLEGARGVLDGVRPPYVVCETTLKGAVTERMSAHGYAASCLDTPQEGWGNILYSLR
jgi:FkbM family methyltransferase